MPYRSTCTSAQGEPVRRYSYAATACAQHLASAGRIAAQYVRATFLRARADAENNPQVIEAVAAGAHEIAARGYAFEDHSKLARSNVPPCNARTMH